MKKPSLKVVVEFKINSITCPNIRLDPSKWVHLRLCLLGTCLRTRLLKAQFPLQVEEKMRVERTFPLCSVIKHLFSALTGERLSIELVQLHQMGSKVLALFRTELNDIIFDSPNTIRDREVRTDHYTMILHTTHHFPGIANPHLNAMVTVKLIQVNDCAIEISRDGGYNLTLGLKGSEYPFYQPSYQDEPLNVSSHWSEKLYPPRTCQRMAITSRIEQSKIKPINRKIFCVRHVDDKLIGRMPSADPSPISAEYTPRSSFFTPAHTVKSPWFRSTFQMETVSSLLRRKPKIIHSLAGPDRDEKCGWYSYDQCQSAGSPSTTEVLQPHHHRHSVTRESTMDSQYAYQQHECELDSSEKRDVDTHWVNHNSEICTLCQLYYEYFGQYYPMHT